MSALYDRYLRLLGVERERPSLDALTRLVRAHLYRVPFENVSKLYNRKRLGFIGLPSLEQYLDGIEHHHFGGTCYTNNYFLYCLIDHLGYRVKLCGADMTNPDVHVVSIATVDDREFLIDVGYAAPFDAPIPRDLPADHSIIQRGDDHYILQQQDEHGWSQLCLIRNGAHRHGYRVNPAPRQIAEFEPIVLQSFRSEATFMNALLMTRFYPHRSRVVHNLTALEIENAETQTRTFAHRDELSIYVEQYFGVSRLVLLEALDDLGDLHGDAWT